MRATWSTIVVLATACGGGGGSQRAADAPKQPLTPKQIVQQASPAIVRIEADEGTGRATGTGFILDKTGLIATNFHVIYGGSDIKVKLYGGEEYPVTAIAGIDPGRDLALLRIQTPKPLPTVKLGDSDLMTAGDQVIAIGNPLGYEYSVTSGLVSQVRPFCTAEMVKAHEEHRARFEELLAKPIRSREEEEELVSLACTRELKLLQISAPISPGSSGGPLFNQAGEVIGITTLIVREAQNLNFAVPANYLRPVVAHPETMSVAEFATKFPRDDEGGAGGGGGSKVVRNVPNHPLTVLDGCKRDDIVGMVQAIQNAIHIGAPLYNQQKPEGYEACYRVYESTATEYAKTAPCAGVKAAFADGLKRVNAIAQDDFKAKAWAMRDTFDGLLDVAGRWAKANGGAAAKP